MKKEEFRLMLIEDSEADIILTKKAIEQGNYSVDLVIFKNAKKALDFLFNEKNAEQLPDLIILDLNMPGLNGFDVFKKVKDNFRLKHLIIIMFSTSDTNKDVLKAYQLGANSFIKKPIDFQEFKEIMNALQTFWFGFAKKGLLDVSNKITN